MPWGPRTRHRAASRRVRVKRDLQAHAATLAARCPGRYRDPRPCAGTRVEPREPGMLPPMLPRRVQPLAGWSIVVAFALIGAALLATVWSTRASILDASDAGRCGQAGAVVQSVRADLTDLDSLPTSAELGAIVHERTDDGLRYLALLEGRD